MSLQPFSHLRIVLYARPLAVGTTESAAPDTVVRPAVNSDAAQDGSALCTRNAAEAELVEEAQARPQAFGPLYELYYSKILGYIYRQTLDAAVAEELTSNTFFKALRGLPRYDHRGHFSAWLYRIATNEINLHRRTASRRLESSQQWHTELDRVWFVSPDLGSEENVAEKMRAFAQLHEAVDRLPHKYRVAISLRYFESMPYADVAEILGKRLGTVKSLIHRGLKQLKRHYQHTLQEEGLPQGCINFVAEVAETSVKPVDS